MNPYLAAKMIREKYANMPVNDGPSVYCADCIDKGDCGANVAAGGKAFCDDDD